MTLIITQIKIEGTAEEFHDFLNKSAKQTVSSSPKEDTTIKELNQSTWVNKKCSGGMPATGARWKTLQARRCQMNGRKRRSVSQAVLAPSGCKTKEEYSKWIIENTFPSCGDFTCSCARIKSH